MQRFRKWLQWKRTWRKIKKAMRRNQRNGIGTTTFYVGSEKEGEFERFIEEVDELKRKAQVK